MIELHWKVESNFKVKVGGNIFINTPNLIVYREEPLFKMYRSTSDGLLGIDFDIYNNSGDKVATIRKGMIHAGNEKDFTIVKEFDHYTITENSSGRIICDIKKREEAGEVELELSVRMHTKDCFLFDANPTGINVRGNYLSGNTFVGLGVGILIAPADYIPRNLTVGIRIHINL